MITTAWPPIDKPHSRCGKTTGAAVVRQGFDHEEEEEPTLLASGEAMVGRLDGGAERGGGVKVKTFRILIVENRSDSARVLVDLLVSRGHRVRCAHTGAAALKLARVFEPEWVLVAVSLPDLDGYEVAALLPGVCGSAQPCIASLSDACGDEERRLSRAAGCVCHLQEPVGMANIEALLAGNSVSANAYPSSRTRGTPAVRERGEFRVSGDEPVCRMMVASKAEATTGRLVRRHLLTPRGTRLRLPAGNMHLPSGNSHFPTTRWTGVVRLLGADDAAMRREALATLCRDYWYPLYAFARRLGRSREDAEDLTQGFFAYVLEKDVFLMADRNLGTLRTFLLKVFQRYIGDVRGREQALKRGGGKEFVSLNVDDGEELYAREMAAPDTPELLFDRSWAQALLRATLTALAAAEQGAGRGRHFEVLQSFLTPDAVAAQGYETVASESGLTPEAARQAVCRLRKKFRECLREQIAATLHEPDDARIDTELSALRAAMHG